MKKEDIIVYEVFKAFGVGLNEIRSINRGQRVVLARFVLIYLLRRYFNWSLLALAYFVGRSDHTTSINALEKAEYMMCKDPALKRKIDKIIDAVDKKTMEVIRLKRQYLMNTRGYVWE